MRIEQGVAWVDLPDSTFRTATPGECAARIAELEAALLVAQRRFEWLAAENDSVVNGIRPSTGAFECRAALAKSK